MESSSPRTIAIIGAGLSGIGSIVSCKEIGLKPVCFEQTDNFAGTWYYREESVEGISSIMKSTVVNLCKELTACSNHPPRKEFNNFMTHEEIYQYACEYAEANDVLRYVRFNSRVTRVEKPDDYDDTGRWRVTVKDLLTGEESTEVFDGVMVCVGHINRPKMPNFQNQENFKGKIMHTHSLKRVDDFRDKNVVVVGIGCSGLDAAVESSNVTKQVYISTRSGAHVAKRVASNGYPFDYLLIRRYLLFFITILPIELVSWIFEVVFLDTMFDKKLYTVKPKRPFLCQDPALSDQIGIKLHTGAVIQKPNIERFTENGVIFEGESSETKADVVIMATGYTWKFPFLEEGVVVHEGGMIDLYKCVFPSHLQQGTLCIIGFFLPFGPGVPLAELQIRWAVQVLAGNLKLPSPRVMLKETRDRYAANLKRFKNDDKASIRVDYIPYMDDLASLIGVKPNLLKYLFTDFRLFMKLVFGPVLAYQYRLVGPHRWEGAREAIMTSDERTTWPLRKRDEEDKESFWLKLVKKMLRFIFLY